jgi:hypothetical protein
VSLTSRVKRGGPIAGLRKWAWTLVLLPVLALGGCAEETSRGNAESAGVREATELAADQARATRRTIRRTVRRAKREETDGSASRTCRFITPDGQARAIQAYSLRYQQPLSSCPQMVRFARKAEADYLSDARRATIKRIKIRDTRATVTVEGPPSGPGDPLGGLVGMKLKKLGAVWRVDDTDFVPYGSGE